MQKSRRNFLKHLVPVSIAITLPTPVLSQAFKLNEKPSLNVSQLNSLDENTVEIDGWILPKSDFL